MPTLRFWQMGVSKNRGQIPQNGWFIFWKTLLKWMIWGAHPYFWKHPNVSQFVDVPMIVHLAGVSEQCVLLLEGYPRCKTDDSACRWMCFKPDFFKRNLYMGVSKNRCTPKSSILIGFSLIFGNTHINIPSSKHHCYKFPSNFGRKTVIISCRPCRSVVPKKWFVDGAVKLRNGLFFSLMAPKSPRQPNNETPKGNPPFLRLSLEGRLSVATAKVFFLKKHPQLMGAK